MVQELDSNQILVVISLDGAHSRNGKAFNDLDSSFSREKVNGSITIHYTQGVRSKVQYTGYKY